MWRLTLFLVLAVSQVLLQALGFDDVNTSDISEAGWSRIVSGWDARPGQHPHQALLRLVDVEASVRSCGSVVIHREWLLTTAFCTAGRISIVVRAGLTDVHKPEMLVESTEYYTYPTYNLSDHKSVQVNDISMIKLPRPLEYSRNLHAIRIQPSSEAFKNYANIVLYTSGFGRNWTEGHRPEILQWVYLEGISNEQCLLNYQSQFISANSLCAVGFNTTTQSICSGDSGGPLVHVSDEGEPILVGITSFVSDSSGGCHGGAPSVFTRTGPFHDWFTNTSGIDFENLQEKTENYPTTPTHIEDPTSTLVTASLEVSTNTPSEIYPTYTDSLISSLSTSDPIPSTRSPTESTTSPSDNGKVDSEHNAEGLSELLKELEVDVKVKYKFGKSENVQINKRNNNTLLKY